jgi:sulfur-carrier protein
MINLLFFAKYREQLNTDKLTLDANDFNSVPAVIEHLKSKGKTWQAVFSQPTLMIALNQQMITSDQRDNISLSDGDELAFFPPVTGG